MGLEKIHIGKFYLTQPKEEADLELDSDQAIETIAPSFDQESLNEELDMVLWGLRRSQGIERGIND